MRWRRRARGGGLLPREVYVAASRREPPGTLVARCDEILAARRLYGRGVHGHGHSEHPAVAVRSRGD